MGMEPGRDVRRLRRLRIAVIGAIAVMLVVILIGARRELQVRARVAAIDLAEDPEAAFADLVADPGVQGTRAVVQAWLRRGDRASAGARVDEAVAAYVRAHAAASHPDDVITTLRSLAMVFRRTANGPGLTRVTADLKARGVEDPELREQSVTAALLRRDVAAAAASLRGSDDWRPLLSGLAAARSTGLQIQHMHVEVADGAPRFRVGLGDGEVVRTGRDLVAFTRLARGVAPIPGGEFGVRGGEVVHPESGAVLWRADDAIATIVGLPARDELVFSYAGQRRGFLRVSGLGSASPRVRIAHDATHADAAELVAAWAGDLDGDGRAELVAAFGPPSAHDLRIFQFDERGELRLVWHEVMGFIAAIATVGSGDRRLLVVAHDGSQPAPALFPEPPHIGEPAGLHLLHWTGEALELVQYIPFPGQPAGVRVHANSGLQVGDFDGDGVDDVMLAITSERGQDALLVHRTDDEHAEVRVLAGLVPLFAGQLDDDAAHEVVVRVLPDGAAWVLGAGHEALPVLDTPPAVNGGAGGCRQTGPVPWDMSLVVLGLSLVRRRRARA